MKHKGLDQVSRVVLLGVASAVYLCGCGSGPLTTPSGPSTSGEGQETNAGRENPKDSLGPAVPDDGTKGIPPNIKVYTFVHHESGRKQPPSTGCTGTVNDQVDAYALLSWVLPSSGITYRTNPQTVPGSVAATFAGAIAGGFQAWTAADSDSKFVGGGTTSAKTTKFDGVNLIAFGQLQRGTIAVTRVWTNTTTGVVAEVDEIFSTAFNWSVNSYDGSNDCGGQPNTMDVQSIHTHEAGHWIGLGHPAETANPSPQDLTMYAYSTYGELKKRSLGLGDVSGANKLASK